MLTRTRTHLETQKELSPEGQKVEESVKDKGFALYEWISPEELHMSIKRDYLQIVRWASIPLAVIAGIFGLIGWAWGIPGVIFMVLMVLGFFYGIVFFILFAKLVRRAYSYARMADVVITDDHYVVGKNIIPNTDIEAIKKSLRYFETTFEEPFLGQSALPHRIESEKKALFENLKDIAFWWGKIIQWVARSRDSGPLVLVILVMWFIYAGMMALVYSVGIFFISLFWRLLSWFAYRALLIANDKEHKIQNLFIRIDASSETLVSLKWSVVSLLDEAGRNEWRENLSKRLDDSFVLMNEKAWSAVDSVVELRKILKDSKYKEIFNFTKYGEWVKRQILEPINEIYELLTKNLKNLKQSIAELDAQISKTSDPSLKRPLELQKTRFEMQIESFGRVIGMLEGYKEKLKMKN